MHKPAAIARSGGITMPLTKVARDRRRGPAVCSTLVALTSATLLLPEPAQADQGGVSFWLSGAFASLAATKSVIRK